MVAQLYCVIVSTVYLGVLVFLQCLRCEAENVLAAIVLDQVEVLQGGDHVLLANAGLLAYLTGEG